MDDLTCSECRKKDTSECPMARAERTVTGEFSGFKTAFEDWEGCSRGEQSTTNANYVKQQGGTTMNIVFIRHSDNRSYLFEVPEGIKLKEGDRVMVRNRRGEVDGICTCDSFELEGSPLNAVATATGATFPLKPVVGRVCVKKFEGIDDV